MGGCGDGGSHGGDGAELINAVLTCEGNISDPDLPRKLSRLTQHLQQITLSGTLSSVCSCSVILYDLSVYK